jgi:outer membrane protein FlgP
MLVLSPLYSRIFLILGVVVLLAGCAMPPQLAVDALPDEASAQTMHLAQTKDLIDAFDAPASGMAFAQTPAIPRLTGKGFAQVAGQPGKTINERRLQAMRAARLEALRDLTEQVHGIRISADSVLRDMVLRNDGLAAQVTGTLRGARTVQIEPRGEDGYFVEMELDADTVAYILRAVGVGA